MPPLWPPPKIALRASPRSSAAVTIPSSNLTLLFANWVAAGDNLWYSAGVETVMSQRRPLVPQAVYRMLTLLCSLVLPLPIGTNLGMLHLLWMLVSGQLLATRGAVIPGLSACG